MRQGAPCGGNRRNARAVERRLEPRIPADRVAIEVDSPNHAAGVHRDALPETRNSPALFRSPSPEMIAVDSPKALAVARRDLLQRRAIERLPSADIPANNFPGGGIHTKYSAIGGGRYVRKNTLNLLPESMGPVPLVYGSVAADTPDGDGATR